MILIAKIGDVLTTPTLADLARFRAVTAATGTLPVAGSGCG
jgi:hypothetical protein